MATPSTNNALVLPGNLRFSAGGLPVTDLTGTFLKSIVDNGNNTYNVTTQQSDGMESTVTVAATGGSGASITSGTADPTGGAAGDAYLQVDASSVIQSIWRNVSGTWTEFTLPAGGVVPPIHVGTAPATRNGNTYEVMTTPPIAGWSYGLKIIFQIPSGDLPVLPDFPMLQPTGLPAREIRGIGGGLLRVDDLQPGVVYEALYESPTLHIIGSSRATELHQGIVRFATEQEALDISRSSLALSPAHIPGLANLFISDANLNVANPSAEPVNLAPSRQSVAEAVESIGAVSDADLDIDDTQSESTTAAASRQAIAEAIASLGGELGSVGPFHYRINQDATQTDSQAAHTLGGIYRNTSGRPLRVREAFVPVHPGGSGATEYNFYVWKVNRASATSYMTDVAAGASESLRTTADGTTIGHDVARGVQSTLHGFTRAEVIIAPGEYFMVVVYRSVNGTAANTIVASGADVSQDYDGALEYVAKASFSGTYGTDPVEVYHNSTFAERMRLIFTFEDEGLLPPIHGIHREEIPDGQDRFPFSDEGEATNPNAYIEWDDLLALIRNVSVYTRSRPQATADNLFDVVISAINQAGDICLDVPHRTTAATGTWTAITPGTDLEYVRVRSSVTAPVQSRYYYEYFTDEFWFGTDVGSGVIRLIQDDANDALASFLTSGSDTVVWLHHHATDAEALLALQTLATGHEAFYWNTTDDEIRKLTDYVPPGVPETGHHYQWVRLFGGPGGGTDGGGDGDTPSEVLFEGPDTPATYVPNVSARPNFRPLLLSRAPLENRTLQIEIEVNTPSNTTANPTPTDANTIYTSDHVETNHLVGDGALPALAGAQLTTFSTTSNQGPSVGNTIGGKVGRGGDNDANDFGHSNLWVGHGLNADGDFVLYAAHSHWQSVAAHVIRVRERSFGGSASGGQTAGGGSLSERRIISESFEPTRSSNVGIGSANNWQFTLTTLDPVLIANVRSFSLGVRVGGREAFPVHLDRRAVLEMGHHPGVGWIWHGSEYDGDSQVPCLVISGKHNSEGQFRYSIQPIRQQIGYYLSNSDVTFLMFLFFDYDAAEENIQGMDVAAVSMQSIEIDWASLFFEEGG